MSINLSEKKCEACEGGVSPLSLTEAKKYQKQVGSSWQISEDGKKIAKQFKWKDFAEAMDFLNRVGQIAEVEGHHPDMHLTSWNKTLIELSTHSIHGLSENDFIMAAKIEELLEGDRQHDTISKWQD